jgi:hypothetical protein
MAENEITSETEAKQEETEYLTDCLKELQCLFNLVQTWELHRSETDVEVDPEILLLIVKAIRAKLNYFQRKYDFRIEKIDQAFVPDLIEFAMVKLNKDDLSYMKIHDSLPLE